MDGPQVGGALRKSSAAMRGATPEDDLAIMQKLRDQYIENLTAQINGIPQKLIQEKQIHHMKGNMLIPQTVTAEGVAAKMRNHEMAYSRAIIPTTRQYSKAVVYGD